MESVQTFGRKKTAVAVAYCKKGRGLIKINGCPIELVEPEMLRYKVFEPILLLGRERFAIMDLRIRVKGGGYTSQIYGAADFSCASPLCTPEGDAPLLPEAWLLDLQRTIHAHRPQTTLPRVRSHPASDRQVGRVLLPEMCAAPPLLQRLCLRRAFSPHWPGWFPTPDLR